jgi:hypothetical protein
MNLEGGHRFDQAIRVHDELMHTHFDLLASQIHFCLEKWSYTGVTMEGRPLAQEQGHSRGTFSGFQLGQYRYFCVVETAIVLETAVLETRGFLNAARLETASANAPAPTHTHPPRLLRP